MRQLHRLIAGLFRHDSFILAPRAGAATGGSLHVRRGVTTLGRRGEANLEVDDPSVSRLHARLDVENDVLSVTDLKSSNGTRVNGDLVVRSPLRPGDVVQFGNVSFEVHHDAQIAWGRLAKVASGVALAVFMIWGVVWGARHWSEQISSSREQERVRHQAVASVTRGIVSFRAGDAFMAQSYFSYAADLLILVELAPEDAASSDPSKVFAPIREELAPEDRTFNFTVASVIPQEQVEAEEHLPNKEYVALKCRHLAAALGQSPEVPLGFQEQVWSVIEQTAKHPSTFQATLKRSRGLNGRIRDILKEADLPGVICYVAWVESGLQPDARSDKGATGLWQFMPDKAKEYGLRVDSEIDERTDVGRSTHAAAHLIGDLMRKFGREQFMCALAGYNRGEYGVWNAMEKIPDPFMDSSKKFWYLVENGLLPAETSEYVPRIFATKIMAEAPERFGFLSP